MKKYNNCFLRIFIIGILIYIIKSNKEINLNNEQRYTINYIDKNIKNNEMNIYFFILKKNAKIKIGLISNLNYNNLDEIKVDIYKKKLNESTEEIFFSKELKLNEILIKDLIGAEDEQIKYYIKYNYKELHDIIITILYNKEEIYTISPTKYNNFINYEYYSIENISIYFKIILYSYNINEKIPIIITGDINDNQFKYDENNDFEKSPDEIIDEVNNSKKLINDIKNINNKNKKFILYYDKSNYNILNIKLILDNKEKKGINQIGISFVYREEVLNNFGKIYMKNSGLFCLINLSNINIKTNTTLIIYTNVTSVLKLYEVEKEQVLNFIFGKSNNCKIHEIEKNKRINIINASKSFENKENYIIFCIENINEDFMFQFLFVNNNNIKYNKYLNRNENINFIREINNSEVIKEQIYFKINEYENINEKYIYFNDIIYGDFKCKTINLDKEIYNNVLNNENLYNPHIINSWAEITIFNNNNILYGYNEFIIKCDNHYNDNLKEGDFIYICLEDNEKTEINMPKNEKNIKFQISILFYKKINNNFFIKINNYNKTFNYNLTNNEYKNNFIWDNNLYGNKIIIQNNNQITILLYLKINTEEKNIQIFENSKNEVIINKNIVYALLLPKNSKNGEIYGIYQEILSSKIKINNICIFHELKSNEDNIFSFPPKASCNNNFNNSKEFNITNYGIYSDKEKRFYTYIYYSGNEQVYLYYKHMIISNESLEHKIINKLNNSDDIIYYNINMIDKKSENNYLFLQLIKEDKNKSFYIFFQNQGTQILNTSLYNYNNIEIFYSKNNYGNLIRYQNNIIPVFKFYGNSQSLFYYEFGNSMTYNYNNDENLKVELFNGTKVKFIFKPFELQGEANYNIYLFKLTSKYTLDILSNPYNIYDIEFKENEYAYKKIFNNIKNINNDFEEDIKSNFIIDFENIDIEIDNYNILLIADKNNPKTKKYYTPIQITLSKNKIIKKLSEIKNGFCSNYYLKEEYKITINLIKDLYIKENGNIIIQWINNSTKNNQKLKIYKNKEKENIIIYNSTNYEYYYILDINKVDDNFDIIYFINDYNNDVVNKICLQYFDYTNTEIEYKYITTSNFFYYINSFENKTIYEIFQLNYNRNIIKELNISLYFYNYNNIWILEKNYTQNFLKDIGDNSFYFGVKINNQKLCFNVKINSKYKLFLNEESFIIKKKEFNSFSLNYQNIIVNNKSQFFFINLTEFLKNEENILIYTNLLDKGLSIFKKNYFLSNNNRINLPLFIPNLEDSLDILTLILYSNNENKGFIDTLKINNNISSFKIEENCEIENIFNKKYTLIKDKYYIICYNKNKNENKYNITYNIEDSNNNKIKVNYLDKITTKNSIKEILNDLSQNIVNDGMIINNNFDLSILKFVYEIRKEGTISRIELKIKNKNNDKNNNDYKDISNDHGGLISAFLFLGVFLIIIIAFWIKNKNKVPETYSNTTSLSAFISEGEKEIKKASIINY